MGYRKFTGFLFFIISILLINLVTTIISDVVIRYLSATHPIKATWLGMLGMIIVLYPAYRYIEAMGEWMTRKIFSAGRNAGGKFFGIIWAFGVASGILFVCYLKLWFHINIWELL